MNKYVIIVFTILLLTPLATKAQRHCRHEAMEAEKVSYLTRNLDLTVMEAQKFWPVYNEYKDEMQANAQAHRDIIKQLDPEESELTEKAIEKTIDKLIQLETEKGNIQQSYHQKFKKVLPTKKVALLYHYDHEFKRYLLKKYRNLKKEKNGLGPDTSLPCE